MLPYLQKSGLGVDYLDVDATCPTNDRRALARVRYGAQTSRAEDDGLLVQVPLTQLGARPVEEVWSCEGSVRLQERLGFRLARSDNWLFGAIELPAADLGQDTRSAYDRLLRIVDEEGAHLLRIWNTVPETLEGPPDLLRYMEFCQGRAQAFEAHYGAGFESHLCAMSAVGSAEGPQCLYFLAGSESGQALENPRQVSAYRYPTHYGPRSPSFARALRGPACSGHTLFLSGTASIVGHESQHAGDVAAQTRETLRNLRQLLGDDDRPVLAKVYLARAADQDEVRAILEEELGRELPTLWLRADVCRPELLVEIEGIALPR